ncbi:unnamed protein product, partial [Adineta ricciae]
MKERAESFVVEFQPEPKKNNHLRSSDVSWSARFSVIGAILGFVCLIPAIVLTLTGAATLNDSDNGRLVS